MNKITTNRTTLMVLALLGLMVFTTVPTYAWFSSYYDSDPSTAGLDGGSGNFSDLTWKANAADTTIATGVSGGTDGAWNYRLNDPAPRLYLTTTNDLVMNLGGNTYELGDGTTIQGSLDVDTAVTTTITNGTITLQELVVGYLDWANLINYATINVVDGGVLNWRKMGSSTDFGQVNLLGDATLYYNYGWNGSIAGGTLNISSSSNSLTFVGAGRRKFNAVLAGAGSIIYDASADGQGVSFEKANTFTGGLSIVDDELILKNSGALNQVNVVTFGTENGNKMLTLFGNDITIGGLAGGDSTSYIQNNVSAGNWGATASDSTLTVDVDAGEAYAFVGELRDNGLASAYKLHLIKDGEGTQSLNGACTYTGSTTVSGGALGGTGSVVSEVTVEAGAGLAPGGSDNVGTFTISNDCTFEENAELNFEYNTTAQDLVDVTGELVLPDSLTVNMVKLDGAERAETVVLFSYGTVSLPTDFSGWTFVDQPGYRAKDDADNNQIVAEWIATGTIICVQ